jgi:hypothetical protein
MTKQEVLNAANVMIAYANGKKVGTRPRRSMEPLLKILYVPTWNWEQKEYCVIPDDVEKEVIDTPRMKAAQMAAMEHMTGDVYRVGCDIERELNAATYEGQHLREAYIQLREGAEKSRQRIKRLEEALESIREYWNRDNNERAMEDACWHAINTASEALEAKEAKL